MAVSAMTQVRYSLPTGGTPAPRPDASQGETVSARKEQRRENRLVQTLRLVHGIRVWEVGRPASEPVLSLWEGDPGSGITFECKWAPDSNALFIEGGSQGFLRWGPMRYRRFRLVYVVKERVLYDLGGRRG